MIYESTTGEKYLIKKNGTVFPVKKEDPFKNKSSNDIYEKVYIVVKSIKEQIYSKKLPTSSSIPSNQKVENPMTPRNLELNSIVALSRKKLKLGKGYTFWNALQNHFVKDEKVNTYLRIEASKI